MSINYRFLKECESEIHQMSLDPNLQRASIEWQLAVHPHKYAYHFSHLGRPIIQLPQDIVAIQELIWEVKPDLIIETGIAHGGSLVLSASILALLDMFDAIDAGIEFDPKVSKRCVIGIDIEIREHNKIEIEKHPLASRIKMIEGSSISNEIIDRVKHEAKDFNRIMVILDSNHTHDHVLAELEAYSGLVNKGSYCIILDTAIEDMPKDFFPNRPWGPGNNPKSAVWKFLNQHTEFKIDRNIQNKLLLTVAPDGYLKRIA